MGAGGNSGQDAEANAQANAEANAQAKTQASAPTGTPSEAPTEAPTGAVPASGLKPTPDDAAAHQTERATVFAPAKINLTLTITGRRPDGYHIMASMVTFADIGDSVTVEAMPPNQPHGPHIAVDGPFGDALVRQTNDLNTLSPLKAIRALGTLIQRDPGSLRVRLTKNLPIASGMGGGTADAVAALKAAAKVWGADLSPTDWHQLALGIGADGPACWAGTPLWMTGIGEEIAPLEQWPALPAVLINPLVSASTPAVFAAHAAQFACGPSLVPRQTHRLAPTGETSADGAPAPPPNTRTPGEALAYLNRYGNTLTGAARRLVPAIATIETQCAALTGVRLHRMTGSGATIFAVCTDYVAAQQISLRIQNMVPHIWARPCWLNGC